jgi:hypothetical protein
MPLRNIAFRDIRQDVLYQTTSSYPPISPSRSEISGTMYLTGLLVIVHSPVSLL